jgi:hypothetical protein
MPLVLVLVLIILLVFIYKTAGGVAVAGTLLGGIVLILGSYLLNY